MSYFEFSRRDLESGKSWGQYCEERGITARHMALGEAWERMKAEKAQLVEHEPSSAISSDHISVSP